MIVSRNFLHRKNSNHKFFLKVPLNFQQALPVPNAGFAGEEQQALFELDPYELETIFTDHNLNFASFENFNDGSEQSIVQAQQNLQYLLNDVEMMDEQKVDVVPKPQEHQLMLVSIPSSIQSADVFNLVPNVQLQQNDVNKIIATSTGYSGVFLTKHSTAPNEPKCEVSTVRRPPLQIIQKVSEGNFQTEPKQIKMKATPVPCKRKQRFNLTREDGIVFIDEPLEPSEDVEKKQKVSARDNDDSFNWPQSDDDVSLTKPTSDESQRCPTCQKSFKKLINHKCKNVAQPSTVESNRCPTCRKIFKNLSYHKCKKSAAETSPKEVDMIPNPDVNEPTEQKNINNLSDHKCNIPKSAAVEPKSCPTCKKSFKKLSSHKCKNAPKFVYNSKPRSVKNSTSRL